MDLAFISLKKFGKTATASDEVIRFLQPDHRAKFGQPHNIILQPGTRTIRPQSMIVRVLLLSNHSQRHNHPDDFNGFVLKIKSPHYYQISKQIR